tara:strand:- start:2583 stop:2888 length:306 start_codon:yes stop_codon:yes gene_type:complete
MKVAKLMTLLYWLSQNPWVIIHFLTMCLFMSIYQTTFFVFNDHMLLWAFAIMVVGIKEVLKGKSFKYKNITAVIVGALTSTIILYGKHCYILYTMKMAYYE